MNAKRTISFLSALCLALTGPAASLNAAAATAPPKDGTGTYEGMKYEIMSGKCYIKGYTSKLAEELVIPSEIKNAKVVWIDNAAFKDCKTLKSVTIPETVTLLNASCFYNCSALETVSIPKANDELRIHGNPFRGTAWLKNKQATDPLVTLGQFVIDGSACTGSVTIPEGIERISPDAFSDNDNITDVSFPNTLVYMGDGAFMDCDGLKSLTIPGSLTEIPSHAFQNSDKLESVTFEEGVEKISMESFMRCTALKNIQFPDTLNHINLCAFQKCSSLESVTLPERLQTIGAGAFAECTALKDISFLNYFTAITVQLPEPDSNLDYGITISNKGEYTKEASYSGVIHGYKGSPAETYAKTLGLNFISLGDVPTSGKCGDSMTWQLTGDTLTFSGSGEMYNYQWPTKFNGEYSAESFQSTPMWFAHRDSIKNAVIGEEISKISGGALYFMPVLESVTVYSKELIIPRAFNGSSINNSMNEEQSPYRTVYNGVIRGYADSTAQAYAEEFTFPFEVIDGKPAETTTTAPVTSAATKPTETSTTGPAVTGSGKPTEAPPANLTTTVPATTTVIGNHEETTTAATTTTVPVTTTIIGNHEETTTAATTTTVPVTTTVIGNHEETTTAATTTTADTTTVPQTTAPDDTIRGTCGEHATWAFNIVLQELAIEGEGATADYDIDQHESAPWYEYSGFEDDVTQRIRHIRIGSGITQIGDGAFFGCDSVENAVIPENVAGVGQNAFYLCSGLDTITFLNPECEIADTEWTISSGIEKNHAFFTGKIRGFKDSTAQKYAEKYGYQFEELDPKTLTPPEAFSLSLKVVPYLNTDGYTDAEKAEYQKKADELMKKVRKITAEGSFLTTDASDPEVKTFQNTEDYLVTDSADNIAALANYDSAPLTVQPEMQANYSPDSGSASAVFSFRDENGTELLRISTDAAAWITKDQIKTYFDKAMVVLDLSKCTAENALDSEGAVIPVASKTAAETYTAADYDSPYALGDIDNDGIVSVVDAQTALVAYTEKMAGNDCGLDAGQLQAADVNRDGKLTVEDAQYILIYYTETRVALRTDLTWKNVLDGSIHQPDENQPADDSGTAA